MKSVTGLAVTVILIAGAVWVASAAYRSVKAR